MILWVFADVSGSGAHGDGRNSTFLNSGGCSVAGAQVGCCARRGKTAEGVGRLLPFIARVADVALFFGFLPWLF